jgi:hypothetical protein
MIHLETDLAKIGRLGVKREDENFRFRSFLKGKDGHKVDQLIHRINKEIVSHFQIFLKSTLIRGRWE